MRNPYKRIIRTEIKKMIRSFDKATTTRSWVESILRDSDQIELESWCKVLHLPCTLKEDVQTSILVGTEKAIGQIIEALCIIGIVDATR